MHRRRTYSSGPDTLQQVINQEFEYVQSPGIVPGPFIPFAVRFRFHRGQFWPRWLPGPPPVTSPTIRVHGHILKGSPDTAKQGIRGKPFASRVSLGHRCTPLAQLTEYLYLCQIRAKEVPPRHNAIASTAINASIAIGDLDRPTMKDTLVV